MFVVASGVFVGLGVFYRPLIQDHSKVALDWKTVENTEYKIKKDKKDRF